MSKQIEFIESEIESIHTQLSEDSTALYQFMEMLVDHGTPVNGIDEQVTACSLLAMIPRFEAMLTVILRDMDANLDSLGLTSDYLHELCTKDKKTGNSDLATA